MPWGRGSGYRGFQDFNDTSTSGGLALTADTWTNVPNDGLGAFTNKAYGPSGDLMNSSGQLDLSGLTLGDVVILRNDIRITTAINNTHAEFRYELGGGAGIYYLTKEIGVLGDGAREYAHQFEQVIYVGDVNTQANLITPQVRTSEDSTLVNLGTSIFVFRR